MGTPPTLYWYRMCPRYEIFPLIVYYHEDLFSRYTTRNKTLAHNPITSIFMCAFVSWLLIWSLRSWSGNSTTTVHFNFYVLVCTLNVYFSMFMTWTRTMWLSHGLWLADLESGLDLDSEGGGDPRPGLRWGAYWERPPTPPLRTNDETKGKWKKTNENMEAK